MTKARKSVKAWAIFLKGSKTPLSTSYGRFLIYTNKQEPSSEIDSDECVIPVNISYTLPKRKKAANEE